tara:strand:+ start:3451 stop:4281 length:831 start_codon:yes stop_codon:yes gene_type:complete
MMAGVSQAQPILAVYAYATSLKNYRLIEKDLKQYPYINDIYTPLVMYNFEGVGDAFVPYLTNFTLPKQYHFHGIVYLNDWTPIIDNTIKRVVRYSTTQPLSPAWKTVAIIERPMLCRGNAKKLQLINGVINSKLHRRFEVYIDPRYLHNGYCTQQDKITKLGTYNLHKLQAEIKKRGRLLLPLFPANIQYVPNVLQKAKAYNVNYRLVVDVNASDNPHALLCQVQQAYGVKDNKIQLPKQFQGIIAIGWMNADKKPERHNLELLHNFIVGKPLSHC